MHLLSGKGSEIGSHFKLNVLHEILAQTSMHC